MRNFFYAPFVVLMMLFATSCEDSNEIDDEIGEGSTGVDAVFIDMPTDVVFDTNLEKWDSKSIYISVDPGSFRVHRGSFSLATSDYFTTTVQAVDDVDDQYEILFRATEDAYDLTDSLEIPMTVIMTFNGFTQVVSDEFTVVFPADRDYPYFMVEPSDTYYKAGFTTSDYCETAFSVVPMHSTVDSASFSIAENPYYTAEFFAGDTTDSYVMRLYPTQDFVEYPSEILNEYYDGIEAVDYTYNWIWGDTTSITMTPVFDVEVADMLTVTSRDIFVVTELQNVDPEFVLLPDSVIFDKNFTIYDTQVLTFAVTPGTKEVTYASFEVISDDADMFEVSSIRESATTDQFEIRLIPTMTAIEGPDHPEDPDYVISAKIRLSYEEYGETVYVESDDVTIFFTADEFETPSFNAAPYSVTFERGSTTSSVLTSLMYVDPGTCTLSPDVFKLADETYYTATFAESTSGTLYEWVVSLTPTAAAIDAARGSDDFVCDLEVMWTEDFTTEDGDGEIYEVTSDPFAVTMEGRIGFDVYYEYRTEQAIIFNMEAFDSELITNEEILEKGVLYTTDSSLDESEWMIKSAPKNGLAYASTYAYTGALTGLTPATTYYAKPFVELDGGMVAYGNTATFTTMSSSSEVLEIGDWAYTASLVPTDAETLAKWNEEVAKAYYYLKTYYMGPNAPLTVATLTYSQASSTSYFSGNVIYLNDAGIEAETIVNFALYNWGLGNENSTWLGSTQNTFETTTGASGVGNDGYYVGYSGAANVYYRRLLNYAADDTTIAIPTNSMTGLLDYGLIEELVNGGAPDEDFIFGGMILNQMLTYDKFLSKWIVSDTTWEPVGGTNIALDKTVSASTYGTTGTAGLLELVDGNKFNDNSRFVCAATETLPVTIDIDLGGEYEVIGCNYYGGWSNFNGGLAGYKIQYYSSETNGQWKDIISKSGQSVSIGYVADLFPTPTVCSKIRYYIDDVGTSNIRLYEIEIMIDYIR